MKPTTLTSTLAAAFFATASLRVDAQQPPATPSAPQALPGPVASSAPRTMVAAPRAGASQNAARWLPYAGSAQGSSAAPPLVIQFTPADSSFVSAMEEDLAIMTRIFEKGLDQLGETPAMSRMGIQLMLTGGARSVRASYMEGFGALFMIKVNFPVIGAAQPAENKSAPATDSEWERARRDLAKRPFAGDGSVRWEGDADGGPQYDPTLVSGLTKALIKTLNNAAHIRHLKPDEFIAVSVFGTPASPARIESGAVNVELIDRSGALVGDRPTQVAAMPSLKLVEKPATVAFSGMPMAAPGTVLTLRAKRADVDALAKGELTFEQFETRVSHHNYPGSGYGITSLNSWVRDAAPRPGYVAPPRK